MIRISSSGRPSARKGRRERERANFEDTRFEQRVGRCVQGVAGRQHIVDEPHAGRRAEARGGAEGPSQVLAPISACELGLSMRIVDAFEGIGGPGRVESSGDSLRDRIGLIETPRATSARVKRNAHDEIGSAGGFFGDAPRQFTSEMIDGPTNHDGGAERTSGRLEARDPSTQGLFVAHQRTTSMQRAALAETSGAAVEEAVHASPFVM